MGEAVLSIALSCLDCEPYLEGADEAVLGNAALGPPEEVRAGALPRHHVADDALGLHAPSAVVQVGELVSHLLSPHTHHHQKSESLLGRA